MLNTLTPRYLSASIPAMSGTTTAAPTDRQCQRIRLALGLELELVAYELARRLGFHVSYHTIRRLDRGVVGYSPQSKATLCAYCVYLADKAADARRHDLQMPPWDMCPSDFTKPNGGA